MAGVVHLDLVTHTLLGERWARGATPPPTPTAPGQPSAWGPPAPPSGARCFISAITSFFLCLVQAFPTLKIKQSSGKTVFYCHFSFGLVCEPRGGHIRVSSSQLPLASRLRDVKGSKSKGRRRSAPASCSLHAGRLLRLCGRSLASICLEESKVFLRSLERD